MGGGGIWVRSDWHTNLICFPPDHDCRRLPAALYVRSSYTLYAELGSGGLHYHTLPKSATHRECHLHYLILLLKDRHCLKIGAQSEVCMHTKNIY